MFIKGIFLRLIAALVSGVYLLSVGFGQPDPYDVRDPESCQLNFSVLSDSHIESNNLARYRIFAKCLRDVRQNKSGNDAVVFLGDNTMNGQNIENLIFHGTVARTLKGENVLPVLGNHDIGNGEGDYEKLQNRWYDYTGSFFDRELSHPYYYDVVDGYYFIVLGMEAQEVYEMYISEEQFSWLEDVLDEAADSGKPVFVFSHYPADDAVDADGNETGRLTEMLADFNREHDLFSFVGHTHMPMHLYWSFQSYYGYPEIFLPRLTELGGSGDNEEYSETGVGVEVEVYPDRVEVRGRDFYRGEWKVDQWEDDGALLEMTYTLKNPIPAN